MTTPPPVLASPSAGGTRSAARTLQGELNLTAEQKATLLEIRRKYNHEETAITNKYSILTAPYQAAAMESSRGKKPMEPKAKQELDAIVKKKLAELEPLKAKQKAEEQALYTPEQQKVLAEFAQKQATK